MKIRRFLTLSALNSRLKSITDKSPPIVFSAAFCVICTFHLMGTPGIRDFSNPLTDKELAKQLNSPDSESEASRYLRKEGDRKKKEYLYWGGLLSDLNPFLTEPQVYETGRAIVRYSNHYSLSPRLIVAVIAVESSGRLYAVSPRGARGLMQVMPFWTARLGIKDDIFSIDTNIRIGCSILAENIRLWGYKEGILRYYSGNKPSGDRYYVKVCSIMEELSDDPDVGA